MMKKFSSQYYRNDTLHKLLRNTDAAIKVIRCTALAISTNYSIKPAKKQTEMKIKTR